MSSIQAIPYALFNVSQSMVATIHPNTIHHSLWLYGQVGLAALILNYMIAVSRYHWAQTTKVKGQLPPAYPSLLPLFGNLISLLWDNEKFLRRITSYGGDPTAARVGVLGHNVYFFQDRESIGKIWRTPCLSSPINISLYTFKHFFGVPEKTLKVYREDNSGPYGKPYHGSNIPQHRRVDYLSHHEFLRPLSGPGLKPTFLRFKGALDNLVDALELSNEWVEHNDFQIFFQGLFGPPIIESIFGPTLLRLNPTLIEDLYEFDNNIPWLARAIPSFIMARPYRIRKRLTSHFRKWHTYATQNFTESSIYQDGDGDPFWGSTFIRNRHAMFSRVGDHDEDAVVALDMGLSFGLISNVSPATLLAVLHIFKDPSLLRRIRSDLDEHSGTLALSDVDPNVLLGIPLLQSVYAEILRLYTNIYVMVSSPQDEVFLGRWRLPKNSISLLNSSVSHKDPQFWNTRNGQHPVESFWAERFLIDPRDASSGPINPNTGSALGGKVITRKAQNDEKPFFSAEGLEASWFPYGGGYSICPGRHLSKKAIIYTTAVLVSELDVEFLSDSLSLDKWRFGLGIASPTNPLPFRIKKRNRN